MPSSRSARVTCFGVSLAVLCDVLPMLLPAASVPAGKLADAESMLALKDLANRLGSGNIWHEGGFPEMSGVLVVMGRGTLHSLQGVSLVLHVCGGWGYGGMSLWPGLCADSGAGAGAAFWADTHVRSNSACKFEFFSCDTITPCAVHPVCFLHLLQSCGFSCS